MEPSNHANNIVIVGAGPVGITTACVLKAINNGFTITVVDKRLDPRRNHGLSIQQDSIARIQEVLDQALENQCPSKEMQSLKNIFENWSGHFVRTNDIELTLAKLAKEMGIQVLRDPAYEISKGDLKTILAPNSSETLSDKQQKLQAILTASSVIIAADGAHSVIREDLGIKLADENTLRYMAELKYQTEGNTQPRGYMEASFFGSKTGYITAETINRGRTENKKPGTFLVFLDADTHKSLQTTDASGKVKGVYGNAWNLDELKERSQVDGRLLDLYETLSSYVNKVKARGGSCTEEKIVGLELKIYRAEHSVKTFYGKPILLVGDANSGLILQRGFNKGLKEVALCAETVNRFFNGPLRLEQPLDGGEPIPSEFLAYQRASVELFDQEKIGIYRKDKGIKVGQFFAGSTAASLHSADVMCASATQKISKTSHASASAADEMKLSSTSILSWLFKSSTQD
jgi:2-polyprenyl-6-methoxyphenol hydroxylase-like FAD-dependent oxidoreductase